MKINLLFLRIIVFAFQIFTFQFIATRSFAAASFSSQNKCVSLFSDLYSQRQIEKVAISSAKHNKLLMDLRSTLSGKLATVWRSEWKTKLSVKKSNQYVYQLLQMQLTPETQALVFDHIDFKSEGFVRQVHQKMYDLRIKNKTNPLDLLTVRDAPPPAGATDSTFTYYTKPLLQKSANAKHSKTQNDSKHQIRIRTYIREIDVLKMNLQEPITGFLPDTKIILTRLAEKKYSLKMNDQEQVLNQKELINQYGSIIKLFAPHGQNYKLEIKSALDDVIQSPIYKNLNGQHNVQKLDVNLNHNQLLDLFNFKHHPDAEIQKLDHLERIHKLESELIALDPKNEKRIQAVFAVLKEGLNTNPDFLHIEGATTYHRSAFESTLGFQTTIDRNQGLYLGNMYQLNQLKNPLAVLDTNHRLITGVDDARHVEFKLPIHLVDQMLGVQFKDSRSKEMVQSTSHDTQPESQKQLSSVIQLFNDFVSDTNHSGKFNYLRESAAEMIIKNEKN